MRGGLSNNCVFEYAILDLPQWVPKPPNRSMVLRYKLSVQVSTYFKVQASNRTVTAFSGLPRTGTASFSAALNILLKGPVYHGGTQILVNDDDSPIKAWIDILSRAPYQNPDDRSYAVDQIRSLTEGYVATADTPLAQFVEEMMEIHPDAKVICTVRDPDE